MIGVPLGFAMVRCLWIGGLMLLSMADPTGATVSVRWLLIVDLVVPASTAYLTIDALRGLRQPRALDDRLPSGERVVRGLGVGAAAGLVSILIGMPLLGADQFGFNNTLIEVVAAVLGAGIVTLLLRRPKAGRCFWCGYDLRGVANCPECGRVRSGEIAG